MTRAQQIGSLLRKWLLGAGRRNRKSESEGGTTQGWLRVWSQWGVTFFLSHRIFFFFFNYLFIYLWLCWVSVSVRGLSLVAESGGHSSSRCAGLSLSWPLPLRSTGSRRAGSAIVAHGLSRSASCGIFPDQGSNPCPLHWQADSQPLCHQGSPPIGFWHVSQSSLSRKSKG